VLASPFLVGVISQIKPIARRHVPGIAFNQDLRLMCRGHAPDS
jgi:hypothetical protein